MVNPRKFRKKPVVIDAWQFFYADAHTQENRAWEETELAEYNIFWDDLDQYWFIETLEGPLAISDGDWIIRGVLGETYPCKPDAFVRTYDEVEEGEQIINVEGRQIEELTESTRVSDGGSGARGDNDTWDESW